jgi:predicted regulator of Ras-like GTPase activity (Roadblock/LC7/MglB family)
MPGYRIHQIERELNRLCHALGGIEGAVVVSVEGLVMAAYPPVGDERPDVEGPAASPQVAAMSAALIALGAQTLQRLAQGEMDRLLVEGESGGIAIIPSGPDAALAVMTNREAKLGIVFHEARRVAGTIAAILERAAQSG